MCIRDRVWPFILCGAALFLAGALLAAAVKPFRRGLEAACNAFLRITRIRPDAGRESVSEEQLRALMDISEEKGAMEADEKEMIENVFDFNDTVAEDVMVHRTDMVMVWTGDTDEEIMETIRSSGLSRFPVYEEDACLLYTSFQAQQDEIVQPPAHEGPVGPVPHAGKQPDHEQIPQQLPALVHPGACLLYTSRCV